jgi:hypothetical protein
MGQTRNTAASVDRGIDKMMMRDHQPQTLTDAELDREHQDVTRPPRAIPCRAWVRYGTAAILVDGLITAWTTQAVAVKWMTPDSIEHRAWLWAGAVTAVA